MRSGAEAAPTVPKCADPGSSEEPRAEFGQNGSAIVPADSAPSVSAFALPVAELQALAAEVLSRGTEALAAVERRDRFVATRLGEALTVALELAVAIAPRTAPPLALR